MLKWAVELKTMESKLAKCQIGVRRIHVNIGVFRGLAVLYFSFRIANYGITVGL